MRSRPARSSWWIAFVASGSLLVSGPPASAQTPAVHQHDPALAGEALRLVEPAAVPDHQIATAIGSWVLRAHGFGVVGGSATSGPRGGREGFGTNMLMGSLSRRAGKGVITTTVGWSLEPLMGPRGYALLLQSGETADDVLPLRDRQHPHDLLSEVSVAYRRDLADDRSAYVSGALVGSPTFGPAMFMHRASASENPEAPLSHHYLDSLHISNGVVSGGFRSAVVTLEGSAFNGVEPDPHRWAMDRLRLDSFAFRFRLDPHPSVVVQASVANLAEPDRLHPTIGVVKLSVSGSVHRAVGAGTLDTTIAFGRNKSKSTVIPLTEAQGRFSAPILAHYVSLADLTNVPADSVFLVFPPRAKSGWLVESTYRRGRSSILGRVERLGRDELFDPTDIRHSQIYAIGKVSAGVVQALLARRGVGLSAGVMGSVHQVPASVTPDYGSHPSSWRVFIRVDLGHGQ